MPIARRCGIATRRRLDHSGRAAPRPCARPGSGDGRQSMPIRPERKCDHCEQMFKPYLGRHDVRFCSLICKKRRAYLVANPRAEKTCVHCDGTFVPAGSNKAIYCSSKCRSASIRRREQSDPTRRLAARERARRYSKTERYRFSQINHKSLRRQVERAGSVTPDQWADQIKLFGNQCAYCPSCGPLTMDHVIPLSKGGQHSIDNVVPACKPCNSSKNNEIWRPRCP